MAPRFTRRAAFAVILAIACAAALAACGGSSPKKSHSDPMLALSECMRAHGIANFPDPSGHGINIGGTGINRAAPAFKAAQSTCFKLMPGGGPNGHRMSKQQIDAMVATSECMRAHGVTGFPDPYAASGSGPPNLNPADYGSVEESGGEVLAIPKSINESSPAFEQAAKTCHFS